MVDEYRILVEKLHFWFSDFNVLKNVNIKFGKNKITAIMGPSGCGKSTLLRCLNRMNDLYPKTRLKGKIIIDGKDIYNNNVDIFKLRKMLGMVFQKPSPLPKSIFDNVAYGLKIHGIKNKKEIHCKVEKALKDSNLWDEVKDKLFKSAFELSGGQQQRLCIARALAVEPEMLLLDEPASALDPVSTAKLEELLESLKEKYTIIIVTHNLQQASRVSDYTAFMYLGEIIEFGKTAKVFTNPQNEKTENYIRGKYG